MDVYAVLKQMTLDEKLHYLTGKDSNASQSLPRFSVPAMRYHDSPFGLRFKKQNDAANPEFHKRMRSAFPNCTNREEVVSTAFPTGAALAATWNIDLLEEVGGALGEEYRAYGVNAVLGPAVNLKRHPLCGRNFEYFSEDPLLAGKLGAAYVRGVQKKGVAACPKHFAANNQERGRFCVSSEIDERTLRELYLKPFEIIVKEAGPWSIMCAYNRLNGIFASEHKQLLDDILRKEWGFDGIVISDWCAVKNRAYSLLASIEMCMPYQEEAYGQLKEAYEQGIITGALIDEAIVHLFTFLERTKTVYQPWEIDFTRHGEIARRAANEAMTLLKNENNALPLVPGTLRTLLVIGDRAIVPFTGGDGSSRVINPPLLTTPLAELRALLGEQTDVQFMPESEIETFQKEVGFMEMDLHERASAADAVVIFAGQSLSCTSETMDRNHIELEPYMEHAIRICGRANKRVIVALNVGDAISTCKWNDCADAILVAFMAGQATGRAVAETLCGKNNPSGKLPETFPARLQDVLSLQNYPGDGFKTEYREKLMIGYRHFDTADISPEYPFGFGLSYSTFVYENLTLTDGVLTFFITNTSDTDGMETAQVYLEFPRTSWASHPKQELRGFKKVFVRAHETVSVQIPLSQDAFCYYNTALHRWIPEKGVYTIRVGANSRDLPLSVLHKIDPTLPYTFG